MSKKLKVTTELVASIGDKVVACNPRNKEWERGTVESITIHVHQSHIHQFPDHLNTTAHYWIQLERRSLVKGNRVFFTVGKDGITKLRK